MEQIARFTRLIPISLNPGELCLAKAAAGSLPSEAMSRVESTWDLAVDVIVWSNGDLTIEVPNNPV